MSGHDDFLKSSRNVVTFCDEPKAASYNVLFCDETQHHVLLVNASYKTNFITNCLWDVRFEEVFVTVDIIINHHVTIMFSS